MDTFLPTTTLIGAAIVGGILLHVGQTHIRGKRFPPGPRRLPIVGNVHQMPTKNAWVLFSEWGKIYGDIVHVDIFGQSMIIINSSKVAKELLDKRSLIYSDRPHFVMAGDLVHYDESFTLLPYGENWRQQRRLVAQDFTQSAVPRYFALQEKEAAILVRNLLARQDDLVSEIKLRIGTIILRVIYGYYVQSKADPFLTTPLAAMANFAVASTPGNFLVDFIPALKYIPRWMPGSGFLKQADEWHQVLWDAVWNIFDWSKNNMETGKTLLPNLCSTYFQENSVEMSKEDELTLMWAASTVMGGGLDTSMSASLSFWMAMILNPDIQRKAQAELDSVVGKDRLPTIADKPNLPYIRSILTEVLRWSPALPLGIPHALSEDDVYNGYEIPKGAMILPNVWSMLHDPEAYPDPMEFKPERFNLLDKEMQTVTDLIFGFGRRACPGMHFAEGTLFAIISTTLATCDILPGLDEHGNEVLPKYAYTPGTIMFPEPFKMRLRPRSAHASALLSEVPSTVEGQARLLVG